MATETTPRLMTKTEYAKYRGVSKPCITKLAKNGVLVLRGGKVDVHASDTVLDDRPVDDVDPPPAHAFSVGPPPRPVAESLGQAGASFGQARTVEMVFRAKLRRLEFETKQGRLIEAEAVRKTIAEAVRTLRDGILGLPDRLATVLAAVLAAESDSKKVHVKMKTELSRELEALANAIGGI
ncbi:MAG: hypothetical protein ABSB15_29930 [Bryobacteraceae bacterium]|jgi:hypothetical protein